MNCYIQHLIAVNADLSVLADRSEIVNEEAVKSLIKNGRADFSNGEIKLCEAQNHAIKNHLSLYKALGLRIITGDEIAKAGLSYLMKVSALELNELRGDSH